MIELLLGHLEKHFDQEDTANIKTSIMNVIQDCMVFAAGNTGAGKRSNQYEGETFISPLGSTMFTGISRLLKFLKKSFQIQSSRSKSPSTNNHDEHHFQTAVIDGIGKIHER